MTIIMVICYFATAFTQRLIWCDLVWCTFLPSSTVIVAQTSHHRYSTTHFGSINSHKMVKCTHKYTHTHGLNKAKKISERTFIMQGSSKYTKKATEETERAMVSKLFSYSKFLFFSILKKYKKMPQQQRIYYIREKKMPKEWSKKKNIRKV